MMRKTGLPTRPGIQRGREGRIKDLSEIKKSEMAAMRTFSESKRTIRSQ